MKLAENEKIIRSYVVKKEKGSGFIVPKRTTTVVVTNHRLIKNVDTGDATQKSNDVEQYFMENIQNIYYGTSHKVNIIMLILGGLIGIIGIFLLILGAMFKEFNYSGLILLIIGIAIVIVFARTIDSAYLIVESKSAGTFFGVGSGKKTKALSFKLSKFVEPDFNKMLDELPAIIIDIHQLGEVAADKWRLQ